VGFEGNAQSLRLVTNVARPRARAERGLNLCFATLGALVKYPCASDAVIETKGPASRKKHGVNEAEDSRFEEIAHALQLARRSDGRAWQRHPLAFLTEAADDIAYGVIDLEDGLRLGLVPAARYDELLEPFLDAATVASVGRVSEAGDREEGLDRAGALRTATVGALMDQVVEAFDTRHDGILDGSWDMSLMKSVPAASAFQALTDAEFKLCYNSRDVLRMEMAGAAAIQGVLEAVVSAALGEKSLRADRLRALIPSFSSDGSVYDSLLASTDYVSGMTDGYVLRQFRELSGTRLPGGRE
jgi:dGTPase